MNIATACNQLRVAEDEFLKLILETDDFEERNQLLGFAKEVRELSDRVRMALESEQNLSSLHHVDINTVSNATEDETHVTSPLSANSSPCFPVLFSKGNYLYKVAEQKDGSLYRKKVPYNNVHTVVDCLCHSLEESSTVSTSEISLEIKNRGISIPDYHIQIVLLALLQANFFSSRKKGKYILSSGVAPKYDDIIHFLRSLEDTYNLSV